MRSNGSIAEDDEHQRPFKFLLHLRQRRRMERRRRFASLLLLTWSTADRICAFTFHPAGRFDKPRRMLSRLKSDSVSVLEYGDDTGDPSDPSQVWLRWMIGGNPRNTADVTLREPEALGGLPRSDRYSSRYAVMAVIKCPHCLYLISLCLNQQQQRLVP